MWPRFRSRESDVRGTSELRRPRVDHERSVVAGIWQDGVWHALPADPAIEAKLLNAALAEAQELRQGEILVCVATDPNWTPLFAIAAGLVTEAGGSLSHAAVVAREYRLPAVLGTHIATRMIHTGQLIEVNGLHGLIRLL